MSEPTDVARAATQVDASRGAQYALVRERIVHEDDLVNQRLIWMITLNGLLFTAYGFSLGAEGSSLAALASAGSGTPAAAAQKVAFDALRHTIDTIRDAIAWVGIGSSLAAFFGVVAANRAIRNDQAYFSDYLYRLTGMERRSPKLPPLVGKWSTNVLGMVSGLAVPFMVAGTWLWTIQKLPNWALVAIGSLLGLFAWLVVWVLKDETQLHYRVRFERMEDVRPAPAARANQETAGAPP